MSTSDLPEMVFIGKKRGQWPLRIFEQETFAINWLRDERQKNDGYEPMIFRVSLRDVVEMEAVVPPPVEAYLRPRDGAA